MMSEWKKAQSKQESDLEKANDTYKDFMNKRVEKVREITSDILLLEAKSSTESSSALKQAFEKIANDYEKRKEQFTFNGIINKEDVALLDEWRKKAEQLAETEQGITGFESFGKYMEEYNKGIEERENALRDELNTFEEYVIKTGKGYD
ncbi:MAG: hypothetical protein HQK77_19065, partial [Desulfobacterales bacterium]|nr:hypothetical protein [Desulfobacterales bacterium]